MRRRKKIKKWMHKEKTSLMSSQLFPESIYTLANANGIRLSEIKATTTELKNLKEALNEKKGYINYCENFVQPDNIQDDALKEYSKNKKKHRIYDTRDLYFILAHDKNDPSSSLRNAKGFILFAPKVYQKQFDYAVQDEISDFKTKKTKMTYIIAVCAQRVKDMPCIGRFLMSLPLSLPNPAGYGLIVGREDASKNFKPNKKAGEFYQSLGFEEKRLHYKDTGKQIPDANQGRFMYRESSATLLELENMLNECLKRQGKLALPTVPVQAPDEDEDEDEDDDEEEEEDDEKWSTPTPLNEAHLVKEAQEAKQAAQQVAQVVTAEANQAVQEAKQVVQEVNQEEQVPVLLQQVPEVAKEVEVAVQEVKAAVEEVKVAVTDVINAENAVQKAADQVVPNPALLDKAVENAEEKKEVLQDAVAAVEEKKEELKQAVAAVEETKEVFKDPDDIATDVENYVILHGFDRDTTDLNGNVRDYFRKLYGDEAYAANIDKIIGEINLWRSVYKLVAAYFKDTGLRKASLSELYNNIQKKVNLGKGAGKNTQAVKEAWIAKHKATIQSLGGDIMHALVDEGVITRSRAAKVRARSLIAKHEKEITLESPTKQAELEKELRGLERETKRWPEFKINYEKFTREQQEDMKAALFEVKAYPQMQASLQELKELEQKRNDARNELYDVLEDGTKSGPAKQSAVRKVTTATQNYAKQLERFTTTAARTINKLDEQREEKASESAKRAEANAAMLLEQQQKAAEATDKATQKALEKKEK